VAEAEKKTLTGGPLGTAADRIRDSAKWLLGSFAAVGAILAAGLQLANIGNLNGQDQSRLVAALVGVAVTVIAIVVAIWQAGRVAAVSYVSLGLLSTPDYSEERAEIETDKALILEGENLGQFSQRAFAAAAAANSAFETYQQAETAVELAQANHPMPPGPNAIEPAEVVEAKRVRDEKAAASEEAYQRAQHFAKRRDSILEVASFLRVRNAYNKARNFMAAAAVAAAAGIVAFAWGANPPHPLSSGELLPATPSDVTVVFSKPVPASVTQVLGPNCDFSNVAAIAMTVTGDTYQVATLKTDTCQAVFLSIPPYVGHVIHRAPETVTPTTP
jgi:hypothetical protein